MSEVFSFFIYLFFSNFLADEVSQSVLGSAELKITAAPDHLTFISGENRVKSDQIALEK